MVPRSAALLLILCSCARPPADACQWPPTPDTTGWPVVDAGPFVFKVPAALANQDAGGSGEYLGVWAGHGRALAFHYGPRAADPRGRATGGEERWSCRTLLSGDSAVIRVGVRAVEVGPGRMQRSAVAEAWWGRAGADSTHLLIVGWGPEADSARIAREALTAAGTVRFRRVWTSVDSLRQLHRFCAGLRAQAEAREEFRRAWEEWRPRCPAGPPPPPANYDSVR